jgi:hypothetical protein
MKFSYERTRSSTLRANESPPHHVISTSNLGLLTDYATDRFRSLCDAAGYGGETHRVVRVVRDLLSPWADVPRGQSSKWVSEISDDNTPIEFSVAMGGKRSEVRILFEPQAEEATLEAYRALGLTFQRRLADEFGADLRRFDAIKELFLPCGMKGTFAVWNAVAFSPDGSPPLFKVYLNPQAYGPEHAQQVVEEGLLRLGLRDAWSALRRGVLRRAPDVDELKYLSLDLSGEPHARVKIYVRHHDAVPTDLEAAASDAEGYCPGEFLEFTRAMRGSDDSLYVRAPFTCSSFLGERPARAVATTVYVPVCAYAEDDAIVQRRVHDYLVQNGTDPSIYDAIVGGFANRPLEAGVGMQSWLALRRYQGRTRLSVYLATEANRVHAPGEVPAPTADSCVLRLDRRRSKFSCAV